MELDIGPHLEEVEIEQYSMGTLPAERISPFEEHFMACDSCQDQLLEMEAYVNAVRSVSPKLRQASPSRWTGLRTRLFPLPRPAWAGMAIAAALLITLLRVPLPSSAPAAVVLLHATRGIEGLAVSAAAAGQPLMLVIDPTEIPASPSYRLEIVGSSGDRISDSGVAPKDGQIVQSVGKGLPAGRYFVRLYNTTGELLREYGLQVR